MDDQGILYAYYGATTIEVLLYENFDAEPQWQQVKIKDISVGTDGLLNGIELIILKDGWPTPWHTTIAKEKFTTDLRQPG